GRHAADDPAVQRRAGAAADVDASRHCARRVPPRSAGAVRSARRPRAGPDPADSGQLRRCCQPERGWDRTKSFPASTPPKLLDFGLAKTTATMQSTATAPTAAAITAQGTSLGTFQYMAPEQSEGRDADTRSDTFAFRCVLYEMLTCSRFRRQ